MPRSMPSATLCSRTCPKVSMMVSASAIGTILRNACRNTGKSVYMGKVPCNQVPYAQGQKLRFLPDARPNTCLSHRQDSVQHVYGWLAPRGRSSNCTGTGPRDCRECQHQIDMDVQELAFPGPRGGVPSAESEKNFSQVPKGYGLVWFTRETTGRFCRAESLLSGAGTSCAMQYCPPRETDMGLVPPAPYPDPPAVSRNRGSCPTL